MQAIIFAFISYLGWGTGDIFGTIATRKIGGYSTTFWFMFFATIIGLILAPFFLDDIQNLTFGLFILIILLGVFGNLIGLVAFYEGLRVGSAAVVGTITSGFVAVTVVLSVVFLKENISFLQTFFILLIFLGIILSGIDLKEARKTKSINQKGVFYAIIAMLAFGFFWTFIKIPVREIGWFWPLFISLFPFPLILVFMKFRKIRLVSPTYKKSLLPLFTNALFLNIGAYSYNYAIERGLVAITAPIAGSYPTLYVLLAFLIFKDPITRQQILGIVTTLIGIVLLSIFSV